MNDIERFGYGAYEFDKHRGEKVLDVGCGFGWLVVNYANNGAIVTGVDIADNSVELAKKWLAFEGLDAQVQQANAETLPFEDNSFDFVSSAGVLHHTVDTQKAIDEVHRVLKPGGESLISLYHKNLLLRPPFFQMTLFLMRLVNMQVVARENFTQSRDVKEFVRKYDGTANPIGSYYTRKESDVLFRNFTILHTELHYFPIRFIPFGKYIPRFIHKLLDNYFGTMIYYKLSK